MRVSQVLQRCLERILAPIHALRRRTLLAAVEALLSIRRLVLIDPRRAALDGENAVIR